MSARRDKRLQERRVHIGRRLRDAREAKGLSQAKVGQIAGCSKSHICQIEGGAGTYSFKIFLAVCDALEVDPSFAFSGVPVRDLDALHRKFEKTISEIGSEAVDFLLSLEPDEIQSQVKRRASRSPPGSTWSSSMTTSSTRSRTMSPAGRLSSLSLTRCKRAGSSTSRRTSSL